jgi:hypothetical protein
MLINREKEIKCYFEGVGHNEFSRKRSKKYLLSIYTERNYFQEQERPDINIHTKQNNA